MGKVLEESDEDQAVSPSMLKAFYSALEPRVCTCEAHCVVIQTIYVFSIGLLKHVIDGYMPKNLIPRFCPTINSHQIEWQKVTQQKFMFKVQNG